MSLFQSKSETVSTLKADSESVVSTVETEVTAVVTCTDSTVVTEGKQLSTVQISTNKLDSLQSSTRSNLVVADKSVDEVLSVCAGPQGPKGDDGSGSGDSAITMIAGENINATIPVYADANGNVFKAYSSVLSHSLSVVGITITSATTGLSIDIKQLGTITSGTWTWAIGAIYVGEGILTQTPPISGFSQVVGIALSATEVLINVQHPIQLL